MKWLHLSDLHINDKVEWDVFKGDLIQHCKRKGPIDLVIVTGDYHDFREKNDFSKAEEFLIELMKNLNLDISKDLFLVPGNHDGSNPICEHKYGNVAALKKDPTRIKGKEWEELVGQFASYEEFVKNVIPGYSFEHPAREHCRIWNNKINFIHCNSAVVSDAEDKDEQLFDINTFAKLALDSTLPSIILIHNNINDIDKNQQEQIKGVIRNSTIKAYFCGDRHIQQVDMINVLEKQNCQIPCIGSYKSAPDAKDNYSSYGIIIGTWIEEKAELEGWTWSMKKSFQLDNIITGQTIEMGEKYNNQVVKNDTGNSSIELVVEKDILPINKANLLRDEQWFRKLVFNLSDKQREKVNIKLGMNSRNITKDETVESINEIFDELIQVKYIDEIIEYMEKLYKEE